MLEKMHPSSHCSADSTLRRNEWESVLCAQASPMKSKYSGLSFLSDAAGVWVDGMDALSVKSATAFAKQYVLENGPLMLEMVSNTLMCCSTELPAASPLPECQLVKCSAHHLQTLQ